jgi:hypothetical protein
VRCSHGHWGGIVGSGLVRIIAFVFPIRGCMVLVKLVMQGIERRPVLEVVGRSVLESEPGNKAWRRRWLRAIDVLVLPAAKQKATC